MPFLQICAKLPVWSPRRVKKGIDSRRPAFQRELVFLAVEEVRGRALKVKLHSFNRSQAKFSLRPLFPMKTVRPVLWEVRAELSQISPGVECEEKSLQLSGNEPRTRSPILTTKD
jgi:hypothetical protein